MVVLSSCEVEYILITLVTCQGVWITHLIKELMGVEVESMMIMMHNQSAIMLSENLAHHNRMEYIDTCHHFIWDCIDDERIITEYVKTKDQQNDVLTKALGRINFEDLCVKIRVKKAWAEVRIKENEGDDSSFISMLVGLALPWSRDRAYGVHLETAIVPTEMAH